MSTYQKVIIIGNLGADPHSFQFKDGGILVTLSLATNESYTKKDTNERIIRTEWHRVIFRNKQAEAIEKYCKKGDKLYVEGSLQTRKWTDEKGIERYTTEINGRKFIFLSNKEEQSSQQNTMPQPRYREDDQDDLPF